MEPRGRVVVYFDGDADDGRFSANKRDRNTVDSARERGEGVRGTCRDVTSH